MEQDETFPTIPKPARLGSRGLKYAPKHLEFFVKNSEEYLPFPPFACPWQVFLAWLMLSPKFLTSKKPGRRPTTAAEKLGKREKAKAKKKMIKL